MVYNFYDINEIVERIKLETECKIYLYPAGNMAKEIIKSLEAEQVKITGIIDSQEKDIFGMHSIQLAKGAIPNDSVIYITSEKYEKELRQELQAVEFSGRIESTFGQLDQKEKIDPLEIRINRMDLVLTTKCTLRCEKCANLMQYYEHPGDIDEKLIKQSMIRLLSVVDEIESIYVIGGEPFIYNKLDEVIDLLRNSEKIKKIIIVTNGTNCLPVDNQKLWEILSNKKVIIQISDYGVLSRNKNNIIVQCSNYHVNCGIEENKVFYDTGNMKKRTRTEEELKTVFSDCSTQCRSLFNGELHYCPRSSHGVDLGIVEKRDEDFVDLINTQNDEELRENVRKFLAKNDYIAACDYCDIRVPGYYDKTYPAAVQAKNILKP